MKPFQLVTIRVSHFNEKARWALDRFSVAYHEKGYMPVLHFLPAVVASRGKGRADRHSSRFSTPILRTDKNEIFCDSTHIVRYVSDRFGQPLTNLFAPAKASERDQYFAAYLAPHSRRYAYYHALSQPETMKRVARRNVGRLQALLFSALLPLIRTLLIRSLRIDAKAAEKSKGYIRKEFEDVAKELADGRKYLLGDSFSAADLSFATAVAPVMLVQPEEGYGAFFPTLTETTAEAAEFARELRESVPGRYVLRMFKEERGRRVIAFA